MNVFFKRPILEMSLSKNEVASQAMAECPVVHRAVFASRAHQDMLGPALKAIEPLKANERCIHRIL